MSRTALHGHSGFVLEVRTKDLPKCLWSTASPKSQSLSQLFPVLLGWVYHQGFF